MNQDEFIKSFRDFDSKCHHTKFNREEIIKLFEIWYNNESQKWINIRNFNQDHHVR